MCVRTFAIWFDVLLLFYMHSQLHVNWLTKHIHVADVGVVVIVLMLNNVVLIETFLNIVSFILYDYYKFMTNMIRWIL